MLQIKSIFVRGENQLDADFLLFYYAFTNGAKQHPDFTKITVDYDTEIDKL